ncbi:hypothetical protein CapIbe_010529 [Capra ibex]
MSLASERIENRKQIQMRKNLIKEYLLHGRASTKTMNNQQQNRRKRQGSVALEMPGDLTLSFQPRGRQKSSSAHVKKRLGS